MNNQELETKIKEILAIDNFFDMIEATIAFEKDYKQTTFFKKTKMPLTQVIKSSKIWYTMQLNDLTQKLQKIINDLDLTKVNEVMDNIAAVFGEENDNIMEQIKSMDLANFWNKAEQQPEEE